MPQPDTHTLPGDNRSVAVANEPPQRDVLLLA